MITYSSDDDGKIYQQIPVYSRPTKYKLKGWTETVVGYINEAKQWAVCVLRNRRLMRRPYTWVVHLNLNEELPPDRIANWWPQVCRKLNDRGIVCLWVREPNRRNKLHYHILVKNVISREALAKAVEEAMPSRKEVRWRKRVEPIKNEWRLIHYIFKAKVQGRTKEGVLVNDLYRRKRLLFKANMPFKKVGTVGDFWEPGVSKKKLWDEIKATEKRISEGLEDSRIRRLVEHVYEWLGDYVSRQQIERSFGYWHDEPYVRNWAERLSAQDAGN